jgi:hypothetical protein
MPILYKLLSAMCLVCAVAISAVIVWIAFVTGGFVYGLGILALCILLRLTWGAK